MKAISFDEAIERTFWVWQSEEAEQGIWMCCHPRSTKYQKRAREAQERRMQYQDVLSNLYGVTQEFVMDSWRHHYHYVERMAYKAARA